MGGGAGGDPMAGMASMLAGKNLVEVVMKSDKLRPYMANAKFMEAVADIQKDNSNFSKYSKDPVIGPGITNLVLECLMQSMNQGGGFPGGFPGAAGGSPFASSAAPNSSAPAPAPAPAPAAAKPAPAPAKPKEVTAETIAELPEEERSNAYKELGNTLYKKRQFDQAIDMYSRGYAADNENVGCLVNRSAVHVETADFAAAEADCKQALSRLSEISGHPEAFKLKARAFERLGNISSKNEDYAAALEYYGKAQVENYTSGTDKKIKEIQGMKKAKEDREYLDDAKALEEKEAGTVLFKEGKFPDAIKRYTESLRRNPKDHTVYSNRAQCYLKLMTPQPAVKDTEKCIELKPDFARGWSRRGMAYKMLKEYTLAMDDFNMALSLDKDNDEAKQGLSQIRMSIYSAQKDETVTQNAMKDPNVKVCSRAAFQTFSQRSARVVSFLSVACRQFSPTPTSITCSRICRQIPRQHSAPCPTRAWRRRLRSLWLQVRVACQHHQPIS
jgi:stress-induced-phosphoprotein 1